MTQFAHARFLTSVADVANLPVTGGAEVAFAGRSNAGKSSAINALTQQSRLAFVSKEPGRKQLINFFELRDGNFLVDLPGYGFARVPAGTRQNWGRLIESYLALRSSLVGLVVVMDIRRALTDLDRQLLYWYLPANRPVHLLLTKADKLSRTEAATTLKKLRAEVASLPMQISAQLFSALKKQGVEEAEEMLMAWFGKNNAPG